LFGAMAAGTDVRLKQFVEKCMAEYDLDGWTAKDLVNTDKLSVLGKAKS
jgi:4-hydroxyphenylacetate 3-monooxygenase